MITLPGTPADRGGTVGPGRGTPADRGGTVGPGKGTPPVRSGTRTAYPLVGGGAVAVPITIPHRRPPGHRSGPDIRRWGLPHLPADGAGPGQAED
ncbi:hypothetical protein Ppa06_46820 [Planomonospora parontospora subsp. parontospora]|uniref:Uncharacterized protein n=2 Tax=Planomonospora parontospora TaxID=58119 RepID=A0AA37BKS6_9ACTN|nr:hypothetical protein GCM10010126_51700 [Planomonospora parontospora]GII10884.1 hypothetical protein Ppa06_46820 [Planomonospora parontospora subsp. parontospora]